MTNLDHLLTAYSLLRQGHSEESVVNTLAAANCSQKEITEILAVLTGKKTLSTIETTHQRPNPHLATILFVSFFSVIIISTIFFAGAVKLKTNQVHALVSPLASHSIAAPVLPTPQPTQNLTTTNSTISPSASDSAAPTPALAKSSKKSYTIALFGDSMIETMGENLNYLHQNLTTNFPQASFTLYNYGVGAENVSQGLNRFDSPLTRNTRSYPPISSVGADIIIIGSYAYNPFSPHDRNRHWQTLAQLLQKARQSQAKVYLLAEIAPLDKDFGQGKNGVNWPETLRLQQSVHIVEQLENAVGLSRALAVPLIDPYHPSQKEGSFGSLQTTDPDNGIHPSAYGQSLTANLISQTIKL